MRAVIWPVVLVAACANHVNQNAKTGPDGKIEGARKLELVDDAVLVKDIVTYPGGDRVDWKAIELPAGKVGKLDLALSYTTPRPGLKVDFDVWDGKQRPVKLEKKKLARKSHATTIDKAEGKYFIRVWAPRRGDAATYKLSAKFEEIKVEPPIDYKSLNLPNPPSLTGVVATRPCDMHDPLNDACKDVCAPGANRKTHPPCIAAALSSAEAEKDKMERLRCDPLIAQWNQAAALAKQNAPVPIERRQTSVSVVGMQIEIQTPVGTNNNIDRTWTADIVQPNGAPIAGGALTIVTINKDVTTLRTQKGLTVNAVQGMNVRFTPSSKAAVLPPKPPGCEKFMP